MTAPITFAERKTILDLRRASTHGAMGMRIIRAIVAGEHNPEVLASLRDLRCHSSIEVITAALVGNDRDEHIFVLTQSLDLYDF